MSDRIVRTPVDEKERAELESILVESFGTDGMPWTTWMERLGHENLRVVTEGGAIRGGLGFYRFAQQWRGRAVPMIGLAGVGVAPAARGTGLARAFLVSTLREARDEGVPLAALYASSVAVYRSVGFEQAGTTIRWSAPIASLPRGAAELACEPFDPSALFAAEGATLRALYEARAARWSGHLARTDAIWKRIALPYKGTPRGYRFGPADAPEGYVVYTHEPGHKALEFSIVVRDLVLATPRATARAMALLSGTRSLATELRWLGCATDPMLSLLPEQSATPIEHSRWMLRILDPARALSLRGYARDGRAELAVHDPLLGDVALSLEVKDGRAAVRTIDRAALRVDVRALAALYAGAIHPSTLAVMGLVEGPAEELDALARLLTDRDPWLCDWF
jgi:predicted acetyltransferase